MLTYILGSAYQVVKFAQGFDGYLASHEVYFDVLEAVPVIPPFVLFNILHPGRLAQGGFKNLERGADFAVMSPEQDPNSHKHERSSSNEEM